jgi:hypothetical protein
MVIQQFDDLSAGDRQLSASWLNSLAEQIERQANLTVSPPLAMEDLPTGQHLYLLDVFNLKLVEPVANIAPGAFGDANVFIWDNTVPGWVASGEVVSVQNPYPTTLPLGSRRVVYFEETANAWVPFEGPIGFELTGVNPSGPDILGVTKLVVDQSTGLYLVAGTAGVGNLFLSACGHTTPGAVILGAQWMGSGEKYFDVVACNFNGLSLPTNAKLHVNGVAYVTDGLGIGPIVGTISGQVYILSRDVTVMNGLLHLGTGGTACDLSGSGTYFTVDIPGSPVAISVIFSNGGVELKRADFQPASFTVWADLVNGGLGPNVPHIGVTVHDKTSAGLEFVGGICTGGTANGAAIGLAVDGSPVNYGVLIVDGSGNLSQVSGLGAAGYVLTSGGAGTPPTWGTLPAASVAVGAAVTGGTAHDVLYVDGSGNLGQISLGNNQLLMGQTSADPVPVTATNLKTGNTVVLRDANGDAQFRKLRVDNNSVDFYNGTYTSSLTWPTMTAARTASLQDASGTLAYLSDITGTVTSVGLSMPSGFTVSGSPVTTSGTLSVTVTGDVSFSSHKLTAVADPTSAQDAATKNYVDSLVNGLDWKASARAATTANGTLATAFANGQVVDGVTLATGDRILLKNQTTQADNGVYTVNASGAPTRSTDADASAEVTSGLSVFVSEGTANGNTQWTLTTDDPITLGTTALVFAQIGGSTTYTGSNGINITGTVITPTYGTAANTITQGNDARLSDARTPVGTALTAAQIWVGSAGNVAAAVAVSGDITITSAGVVTTANGAVTLAKMADMATASLIYRKTAGSGAPEVNSLATLKTDLGLTGTNSGDQTITLTGDVTGSGTGSFAATIAALAVTDAKVAAANKDGAAATPSMRTLGTGAAQAAAGNDTRIVNAVQTTRAISTGTDLRGGGDLSANRTIDLDVESFAAGRLTLTSNTPVTVSDVTAATTIYYSPYQGNSISLYNGVNFQARRFTETSVAVPSTLFRLFDIYGYDNSGTFALETLDWDQTTGTITGATAANPCVITSNSHGLSNGDLVGIAGIVGTVGTDATRGVNGKIYEVAGVTTNTFQLAGSNTTTTAYTSGGTWYKIPNTRTTALILLNGTWYKTGDLTRRYLGTGMTTGTSGQTEDSAAKRLLWNNHNRCLKFLKVIEGSASWTYTVNTWRAANGSTANRVQIVRGLDEDSMEATVHGTAGNGSVVNYAVGIGLKTTSANSAETFGSVSSGTTLGYAPLTAEYRGCPGIGYSFFQWLENSAAVGTTTWIGNNSTTVNQCGLVASGLF